MYCPECSRDKESKGIGLCGECYQTHKEKYQSALDLMGKDTLEIKELKDKLKATEAVVEWYAERARSLAGWDRKSPSIKLEAIVTELCLDGGKRAAALDNLDKEKDA